VGVLFSYKNTTIDKFDGVNDVKSKNILLSPYFKYYHDINEKVDVMAVANMLLLLEVQNWVQMRQISLIMV